MSELSAAAGDAIDLAVLAYHDDDEWIVAELPSRALTSVEAIVAELRRYPGESGTLALVSVDEDFALLVRSLGSTTKVLLSDASAAQDWDLARSAVTSVGVHLQGDDDLVPVGDLAIFADLGVSAIDLEVMFGDLALYPDEVLSEIAAKIGFGAKFDELVGLD